MGRHLLELHLGHDGQPERRRLLAPRRLHQRSVERTRLGDAAAPCVLVDAADVLQHATDIRVLGAQSALADLERRAFPLLVWSAHTVDKEYFDRERFDPRGQLLSALTNLGLHTPEFFAAPSSDGTTVKGPAGRWNSVEMPPCGRWCAKVQATALCS